MKYIYFALLSSAILMANTIKVTVKDIKNNHGKLYIGLYNNPKYFGSITNTYKKKIIKIKSKSTQYIFKNIPEGIYAISLFHDENSNGKLDTNLFGIPKEGYGFSNNKRFKLRSATFKESSFLVNKNKSVSIRIGY